MAARTRRVSTLLEILGAGGAGGGQADQRHVSTLLEILAVIKVGGSSPSSRPVSTLLEILAERSSLCSAPTTHLFQPFLRFWGLCGWLLWVFKFFFGFL